MEFILDFQGFKNEKNDYIVKELAIMSTDARIYELHLFLPPYNLRQLSKNMKNKYTG